MIYNKGEYMKKNKNYFNYLIIFAVTAFALLPTVARADVIKKNIPMYMGIPYDESVSQMPTDYETSGTYKSLVTVSYDDVKKVLRLTPKKEGLGTLVIFDKNSKAPVYEFTVDIRKTDLTKVMREMTSLLSEIEGITIKIANNKVVVDGQIMLASDIKRIHNVVQQYVPLATSLVTLSPAAQVKIAQFIERAIGNPEIHVKAVNNKFMLEGIAEDEKEKSRAEIIAKTYVPDIVVDPAAASGAVRERMMMDVINLITLKVAPEAEPSRMVQVIVHFVELQKNYEKRFRFQWTPDIGENSGVSFTSGNSSPSGLTSTITGTITNLIPKLNWAKEHGHARVLQSSSLVVENGKQGIIDSTRSIPYTTFSSTGQPNTNTRDAGINTTVTPQIIGSRSDSVNLKLSFTVSSFEGDVNGIPITSKNSINTEIVVRSGASAAIGGLISNSSNAGYNRLPANASTNPIISLYASKQFTRNQSQFVVFVTPLIKSSASSGAENIKRKFRLRD
ncbi:MAG: hypothetical protein A2Z20_05455 [Bdellovibrionales bacterium RBG_16_40_8]|nr:MAG: hypothetical protein A2Z20_05455 [Bdellovibrionales bacterium RBG_16_40_8]